MSLALLTLAAALVGPPAGTDDPAPGAASAKQRAQDAVRRAHAAAAAGEFDRALAGFEEAMATLPSSKLHHNIAVCHHQLMLGAPDEPARERHRAAAVDAYLAYLQAHPDAPDRAEIEAVVLSLGGTLPRDDGPALVIERIDPEDGPAPPPLLPAESSPAPLQAPPSPAPNTPAQPPPTEAQWTPAALIGVAFSLGLVEPRALAGNGDVQGLPLYGAGLWAGGFVGKRKRAIVGAEFFWGTGAGGDPTKHGLSGGHIGIFSGYGWTLGANRRLAVGAGGMFALAGNTLVRRDPPGDEATCPVEGGTFDDVSQRGGLVFGARARIGVLLGRRRNHELAWRIAPGLGLYGEGSKGGMADACQGDEAVTPFEQFGLDGGAVFVVNSDLGYAVRF